ncbi:MAG TPA: DHH family phosphoesterase [Herpetosiphonaceae bacterium]
MRAADIDDLQQQFRAFVGRLVHGPTIAVLCHSDADGIAAGAILVRALRQLGHTVAVEVTRKGEHGWSASVRDRLDRVKPQALIVADLGSRDQPILADVPTLLIDHHRPAGVAPNAALLTGYGHDPTPTAGLLAYWCASAVTDTDAWCWIAAISILSDIGERAPFALLDDARRRYKATPLREATTLLNAPRRSASGDTTPALHLLLTSDEPRAIISGAAPEVERLKQAKTEVNRAFAEAKKAAPRFSGNVAAIRIHTPCQVHPLIAQIWRTRLPTYIVLGVNTGYLPGYVNFSARAPRELNLLDFLRQHAPADAGAAYGHGHDQASGGMLRYSAWNEFIDGLGFGPEMHVQSQENGRDRRSVQD